MAKVVICPTVTALDPHEYRRQMEQLAPFAERVHIDFMDGVLAPTKSPGIESAWWLKTVVADLHVMYKNPVDHIDTMIGLAPSLVILHAEAHGDFLEMADKLHKADIKVGVALLPDTAVDKIKLSLPVIDHVLMFSGDLGHFGGKANLELLEKVKTLKQLKPSLELGWDGGINDQNVRQLAEGGIDVLNVGGFIHQAKDPEAAYGKLKKKVDDLSHETKTDA